MFDKDLFLSLCEKYNVELSATATSPMIKNGEQIHPIADNNTNPNNINNNTLKEKQL